MAEARAPLWRQIQADVYGREVEIVEAEEGAAYGAAILAGVGLQMWPSVDAACEAGGACVSASASGASRCSHDAKGICRLWPDLYGNEINISDLVSPQGREV